MTFLMLVFWILPIIIALMRDSSNTFIIFLLNIVFGWFLPAWIFLFAWAVIGWPKNVL